MLRILTALNRSSGVQALLSSSHIYRYSSKPENSPSETEIEIEISDEEYREDEYLAQRQEVFQELYSRSYKDLLKGSASSQETKHYASRSNRSKP